RFMIPTTPAAAAATREATPRRIAVLGSTGSIGRQTLDVVRAYPDRFRVVALVARGNVALLAEQAREFAPDLVACTSDEPATVAELERSLPQALRSVEGLTAAATHPDVDTVVAPTSRTVGFGLPFEQIEVVVHPQSVIHSMVEFVDDSIKMQASLPSMHLPIQDALSYPDRLDRSGTALAHPLRWPEVARLDFEPVDRERFPC